MQGTENYKQAWRIWKKKTVEIKKKKSLKFNGQAYQQIRQSKERVGELKSKSSEIIQNVRQSSKKMGKENTVRRPESGHSQTEAPKRQYQEQGEGNFQSTNETHQPTDLRSIKNLQQDK